MVYHDPNVSRERTTTRADLGVVGVGVVHNVNLQRGSIVMRVHRTNCICTYGTGSGERQGGWGRERA